MRQADRFARVAALCGAVALVAGLSVALPAPAQEAPLADTEGSVSATVDPPIEAPVPPPAEPVAPPAAQDAPAPQEASAGKAPRDPNRGAVTNLPLPRFVSLKSKEGNARRGPGLTHRIDWVFTRAGMPLRITAEYENWRRVEDIEGAGGWVHYSLLSGVRSALIVEAVADFRSIPDDRGQVVLKAEQGVIGRVLECTPDWCRLNTEGGKGWVRKAALWGVEPGEVIE